MSLLSKLTGGSAGKTGGTPAQAEEAPARPSTVWQFAGAAAQGFIGDEQLRVIELGEDIVIHMKLLAHPYRFPPEPPPKLPLEQQLKEVRSLCAKSESVKEFRRWQRKYQDAELQLDSLDRQRARLELEHRDLMAGDRTGIDLATSLKTNRKALAEVVAQIALAKEALPLVKTELDRHQAQAIRETTALAKQMAETCNQLPSVDLALAIFMAGVGPLLDQLVLSWLAMRYQQESPLIELAKRALLAEESVVEQPPAAPATPPAGDPVPGRVGVGT
jgi:hypothetical protein